MKQFQSRLSLLILNYLFGAIFLAGGITWTALVFPKLWPITIIFPALLLFSALVYLSIKNIDTKFHVHLLFLSILVLTVALLFLFNLSWSIYWPLFIIIPSIWIITFGWSSKDATYVHDCLFRLIMYVGFSAFALGLIFLLKQLHVLNASEFVQHWWALFIVIPSFAFFHNFIAEYVKNKSLRMTILNLNGFFIVFVAGINNLFQFDWKLANAILFCMIGLLFLINNWLLSTKRS